LPRPLADSSSESSIRQLRVRRACAGYPFSGSSSGLSSSLAVAFRPSFLNLVLKWWPQAKHRYFLLPVNVPAIRSMKFRSTLAILFEPHNGQIRLCFAGLRYSVGTRIKIPEGPRCRQPTASFAGTGAGNRPDRNQTSRIQGTAFISRNPDMLIVCGLDSADATVSTEPLQPASVQRQPSRTPTILRIRAPPPCARNSLN